jgi:hypothetical protein
VLHEHATCHPAMQKINLFLLQVLRHKSCMCSLLSSLRTACAPVKTFSCICWL